MDESAGWEGNRYSSDQGFPCISFFLIVVFTEACHWTLHWDRWIHTPTLFLEIYFSYIPPIYVKIFKVISLLEGFRLELSCFSHFSYVCFRPLLLVHIDLMFVIFGDWKARPAYSEPPHYAIFLIRLLLSLQWSIFSRQYVYPTLRHVQEHHLCRTSYWAKLSLGKGVSNLVLTLI